ncbi:MAG: hypothetical protein GY729_02815, partial [Desulfobacteraceae bacterium]|nr:hypothetical protein [Desulfobacteraceae bacterium]
MKFFNDFSRISTGFANCITTIDSHTQGESTRLIVNGLEEIKGISMMDKLEWFKSRYDHIRCLLTKEPRGANNLSALVTENVTPNAKFGLIYMDAKRYPYLCGHATIGAVVTLARTGFLKFEPGESTIYIDTPSGVMDVTVFVRNNRLDSVAVNMVPSFVYDTDQVVDV